MAMHRSYGRLLLIAFLGAMPLTHALATAPTIIPDAPVFHLDEIGFYDVGYALNGRPEQRFPVGWTGYFEETVGIACQSAGDIGGKRAFLLHCPWRKGAGISFQEFRVHLPNGKPATLEGAVAIREDAVGKSDGADFHVFVNGRKLLDTNRADGAWKPFRFDLSSYSGKTVCIRFETGPGPKNDASFDFSLWGNRRIVFGNFVPRPVHHPLPPALQLQRLLPQREGGAVPPSVYPAKRTLSLSGNTAILRYSGADGVLEYRWEMPEKPGNGTFGKMTLRAKMPHDAPVIVPLATQAAIDWVAPARKLSARWEKHGSAVSYIQSFEVGGSTATLRITATMVGKSLVLDVACDRPVIRSLETGGWGPVMRIRRISIPYYSGVVSYLPTENLFTGASLDWTRSNAATQDRCRAEYPALTDGSRNLLSERAIFTAAWNIAETFPNIPNPPSPYLKDIGNRIVLDSWGGSFSEIAGKLQTLASYGFNKAVLLVHDWQRSGYDNALPAHVPANASYGGDTGMKYLVETGIRLGFRVALHENYVDYYPNYEGFDEKDITLDSNGNRVLAWFNPGTKIQSFGIQPNAIGRLAAGESPRIHQRYGTNADYLDVHSAVPPWFHVDSRAGEPGAGTFSRVWESHRDLWAFERTTHNGPVFGEGNNHWYWSGLLDGVEAQFGAGWPANEGRNAPLMVDFDLLKIHPLQFNHGMGYYERWWSRSPWGAIPPMAVLDQYRMQEVAYGHAGFLGASAWNVVPLAWLEHHLLTPVTERYAATVPVDIAYQVAGKWVDGTRAAVAGDWNRVRIRYANGLVVTANNAPGNMTVAGVTLPQYGWLAQGAGVTAYTALRNGIHVDYSRTAGSVFVNARPERDWDYSGIRRVRPSVSRFQQTGTRTFKADYSWRIDDNLEKDYTAFVHFQKAGLIAANEVMAFQQDHAPRVPTSKWQRGETVEDGGYTIRVPDGLPDGDYEWLIGLFSPGEGRVPIQGPGDGSSRIRLGILHIRHDGAELDFEADGSPGIDRTRPYREHLNRQETVIDFGEIRTNGSVLVRREGKQWVLRTYPRNRTFVLELNAKRFPVPKGIQCISGTKDIIDPKARAGWWRLPLTGAVEYRWPAS